MEVKVTHIDRVKFLIKAGSNSIVCDQPTENGGDDEGLTPPELLLASLGSCAAFYAAQYFKGRGLADSGAFIGFNFTFLPQFLLGMLGMPRRL